MLKKPTRQSDKRPNRLSRIVSGWPGVEIRSSRFGPSKAFFVEGREFAHFHGPKELDIRLTRSVQRERQELMQDERLEFREKPSDWVTFRLENSADDKAAETLLRLAWGANGGQRIP